MVTRRDNAAYRVIEAREQANIDLVEKHGYLWNPSASVLLAVWDYEPDPERPTEFTVRDSHGHAVDVVAYSGPALEGDAVAAALESGELLAETERATGIETDLWPMRFVEEGTAGYLTAEQALTAEPSGWVAVEHPNVSEVAAGRQVLGVRTALAAAERARAEAAVAAAREAVPVPEGCERGTGCAYVPQSVALDDLVEAYKRDWTRDYDAMLESGEISLDEHAAATAGLDATLRREFGDAYGTGNPVPAKPERGSVGRSLAYLDSLVAQRLDPKGRVALGEALDDSGRRHTLVYLGGEVSPFAVVEGYDTRTGEWSSGSYFKTVAAAQAELDARDRSVIACVRLGRDVLEDVLAKDGYASCTANVRDVLNAAEDASDRDNPCGKSLADHMKEAATQALDDVVVMIGGGLERGEASEERAGVQWLNHVAENAVKDEPDGEGR